jgi:hypothetical protein
MNSSVKLGIKIKELVVVARAFEPVRCAHRCVS